MELRIKDEYIDNTITCPYTGKPTYLRFLELGMYIFWFKKMPHLFEEVNPKLKKKYIKL